MAAQTELLADAQGTQCKRLRSMMELNRNILFDRKKVSSKFLHSATRFSNNLHRSVQRSVLQHVSKNKLKRFLLNLLTLVTKAHRPALHPKTSIIVFSRHAKVCSEQTSYRREFRIPYFLKSPVYEAFQKNTAFSITMLSLLSHASDAFRSSMVYQSRCKRLVAFQYVRSASSFIWQFEIQLINESISFCFVPKKLRTLERSMLSEGSVMQNWKRLQFHSLRFVSSLWTVLASQRLRFHISWTRQRPSEVACLKLDLLDRSNVAIPIGSICGPVTRENGLWANHVAEVTQIILTYSYSEDSFSASLYVKLKNRSKEIMDKYFLKYSDTLVARFF